MALQLSILQLIKFPLRILHRIPYCDCCVILYRNPPGGYAINVQWYTQKVIGALEYAIEGGDNAQTFVQSNKDLVLTGFDDHMHQVIGARTHAPRQRTVQSNRLEGFEYSLPRQSLQTTEGDWYRK